jgi:hypothetical protein
MSAIAPTLTWQVVQGFPVALAYAGVALVGRVVTARPARTIAAGTASFSTRMVALLWNLWIEPGEAEARRPDILKYYNLNVVKRSGISD